MWAKKPLDFYPNNFSGTRFTRYETRRFFSREIRAATPRRTTFRIPGDTENLREKRSFAVLHQRFFMIPRGLNGSSAVENRETRLLLFVHKSSGLSSGATTRTYFLRHSNSRISAGLGRRQKRTVATPCDPCTRIVAQVGQFTTYYYVCVSSTAWFREKNTFYKNNMFNISTDERCSYRFLAMLLMSATSIEYQNRHFFFLFYQFRYFIHFRVIIYHSVSAILNVLLKYV